MLIRGDNMNLVIRHLTVNDQELYKKIRLELLLNEPHSFGSSFEEESLFEDKIWEQRLSKKNVFTIGAFVDSVIVGVCVVVTNPRNKMKHVATLHSMYVINSYRKKGVAHKLIQSAEKTVVTKGVLRMNLSVVKTNSNASKLYQKLGYHEYGLEPNAIHVEDRYHSLILMTKELN